MTVSELNNFSKNTMISTLGIEFTKVENSVIQAEMPVNKNNIQPLGFLHGGALLSLAETLASAGSYVNNPDKLVFGISVSAQHVKSTKEGKVKGIATLKRKTSNFDFWQIDIFNEQDELLSTCQVSNAIVTKKD